MTRTSNAVPLSGRIRNHYDNCEMCQAVGRIVWHNLNDTPPTGKKPHSQPWVDAHKEEGTGEVEK